MVPPVFFLGLLMTSLGALSASPFFLYSDSKGHASPTTFPRMATNGLLFPFSLFSRAPFLLPSLSRRNAFFSSPPFPVRRLVLADNAVLGDSPSLHCGFFFRYFKIFLLADWGPPPPPLGIVLFPFTSLQFFF